MEPLKERESMSDLEIKEPVKEAYTPGEILGEKGTPELTAALEHESNEKEKQPPQNLNLRFKAILMFDSKINENVEDLIMPPQYAGTRVMLVKKGKILARNWDKIIGVDTTQYELTEKDADYVKPEVLDGQEQKNT